MRNNKVPYTSSELFEILKEQYRLCNLLNLTDDPSLTLTSDTKIWEWHSAQDLLPWYELGLFFNQEFQIDVDLNTWKKVLSQDDRNTLGNLCDFLSTVAQKEIVSPIKRLGTECISAAVFLTLKKNLKRKGVDTTELKPSTLIEPFLEKNFSPLMEEITLTGVKTFDSLSYGKLETENKIKYWIDRILPNIIYRRPIKTGKIQTFRDLVERIIENEALGNEKEIAQL